MRRRKFMALVAGTAVWPLAVRAQQLGRIPVVGVFWAYADAEDRRSFLKGLADLGYIPEKTFILEERYANGGAPERLDALAVELIALNVHVLVSQAGKPTVALHQATASILLHRKSRTNPRLSLGRCRRLCRKNDEPPRTGSLCSRHPLALSFP